jgi:hypothetical protein
MRVEPVFRLSKNLTSRIEGASGHAGELPTIAAFHHPPSKAALPLSAQEPQGGFWQDLPVSSARPFVTFSDEPLHPENCGTCRFRA